MFPRLFGVLLFTQCLAGLAWAGDARRADPLDRSSSSAAADPLSSDGKNRPAPPSSGKDSSAGRLPPEQIQRVIKQNAGQMRRCYEEGLRKNPKLKGRVNVRFIIGKDGVVTKADDAGSDMSDDAVTACVVRAFSGMTFPKPTGGTVTVTYPFVFSAG